MLALSGISGILDSMTEPAAQGARVRDYRDLVVWRSALKLAAECHRVARKLPREEWGDLSRQLRRAAVSVVANIAEGNGRFTRADYLRHLSIANGSLKEVEAHLLLARECDYLRELDARTALQLAAQTGRMLTALVRSLRKSTHP